MEIEAEVKEFIIENFLYGDDSRELGTDESFYDKGIVDSTGVLSIINFIEERFSVTVADEEIIPENFDSIGKIVEYIGKKSNEAAKL